MNRILSLIFTSAIATTAMAQVSDGFYRVQNYGSRRYVYVCDNTGSINWAAHSADLGAIPLFKDADRRYSDPASIIYCAVQKASESETEIDLEAQGVKVSNLINMYVTLTAGTRKNTYWLYSYSVSSYLWDETTNTTDEQSYLGYSYPSGTNITDYRNWSVTPISASGTEYFGLKPETTMTVDGKYYKPFYMAFPFDFASTGMKAYYVSAVHDDAVVIKEITGVVPAMTPVIVECSTAEATTNRVNVYHDSSVTNITDNQLSGNMFCYDGHQTSEASHVGYDSSTMRVLAVKDGKLQYVTDTNYEHTTAMSISGSSYSHFLNANESYLNVDAGTAENLVVMTEAEYEAIHDKKGDLNHDGKVSTGDVVTLYNLIINGATPTTNPEADFNNDNKISTGDVVSLYNIIIAGQ